MLAASKWSMHRMRAVWGAGWVCYGVGVRARVDGLLTSTSQPHTPSFSRQSKTV